MGVIDLGLVPTADIFTATALRLNLGLFFSTGFTGGGLLRVRVILLGFIRELNICSGLLGQSRCLYQTGVFRWRGLFKVHGNLRSRLPRFIRGILVPQVIWCQRSGVGGAGPVLEGDGPGSSCQTERDILPEG